MYDDINQHTDEDLMARIISGDHQAFGVLVTRHTRRFFHAAYRYCPHVQTAEDIVQEAFIKLWLKRDKWDPARGAKFTTWFTRIVSNQALDTIRKKRPESGVDYLDIYPSSAPNAEQVLHRTAQQEALEQAIHDLPARQKMAVNLCVYEDMSNKDAASVMDIGVKALESLLVRARKALRNTLMRDGIVSDKSQDTKTTGQAI